MFTTLSSIIKISVSNRSMHVFDLITGNTVHSIIKSKYQTDNVKCYQHKAIWKCAVTFSSSYTETSYLSIIFYVPPN